MKEQTSRTAAGSVDAGSKWSGPTTGMTLALYIRSRPYVPAEGNRQVPARQCGADLEAHRERKCDDDDTILG